MNHQDHISLLKSGVPAQSRVWADFGSGSGAFTIALAELIGRDGIIYSVDKDKGAVKQQEQKMQSKFPNLEVRYLVADFAKPFAVPQLDGILMANALHYIKEKESFILQIKEYLKPEGRLLVVEYNIDRGNPWVPFPISFKSWQKLASKCGFIKIRILKTMPSRYHEEVYSSVAELM